MARKDIFHTFQLTSASFRVDDGTNCVVLVFGGGVAVCIHGSYAGIVEFAEKIKRDVPAMYRTDQSPTSFSAEDNSTPEYSDGSDERRGAERFVIPSTVVIEDDAGVTEIEPELQPIPIPAHGGEVE